MSQPLGLTVSVGILAHNEELLIEHVVRGYLAQQTSAAEITEIVVVSCGSTDSTVARAAAIAVTSPSVRVIVRRERQGKLGAISTFAEQATGTVLVIAAADAVPSNTVVEQLTLPFLTSQTCGMTGPQVCPDPSQRGLTSRLHGVLWLLHHKMALRAPKLGEVVAVRAHHLRRRLPSEVHCDEVLLEARVLDEKGTLQYAPTARVMNFAPANLRDLFCQRRRIACQHAAARRYLDYRPASDRPGFIVVAVGRVLGDDPGTAGFIVALGVLESAARVAGLVDFHRGERYRTWSPARRSAPFPDPEPTR